MLPAAVPAERFVARTSEVAISISRLWVHRAGFEFEVFVDADDEWADLDPFDYQRYSRGSGDDGPSSDRLLLGFAFPDGSKATNVDDRVGWSGESDERSPVLVSRHGGSGGGHWHSAYWVWPLPTSGPFEFVCQWEAAGIPLTRCDLDAAAVISAASRAREIFVDDRETTR